MELNHFIFKLVSSEQVDTLRTLQPNHEAFKTHLGRLLASKLDKELLSKHTASKRAHLKSVLLDFLAQITTLFMLKCTGENDKNKISVSIQLVTELLLQSVTKHMSKPQSSALMCELINRHSGEDPPRRFKVFELQDLRMLSSLLVERFYFHYDDYMQVFATQRVVHYRFAQMHTGNFPKSLALEFGQKLQHPETHPLLKELYFSNNQEDELDELELEELMQGKLLCESGNAGAKLTIKKKEAIIRKRMEAERKKIIEEILQKKIIALQKELGVQIDELRKEFDLTEEGASPSK